MSSKFFSRRIAFFGNIALVILCVIFFLVPFGFRGARMAVDGMRNDVTDWLPSDFKETEELRWFHKYFIGGSFVIVTWPGANENDQTFKDFVAKLRAETKPLHDELADPNLPPEEYERRRARLEADKLGLFIDVNVDDEGTPIEDDLNENWGGLGEKWLTGDDNTRYFITPDGELFRWTGKSNLIGFLKRQGERLITGGNDAKGVLVDKFGKPSKPGSPNEFHENPRLLTARLFHTIQTGPDVLEDLAGKGGSLRPYNADESDEESGAARDLAYKRLSGLLFGPVVPKDFSWELDDFKKICPDERLATLPRGWEKHCTRYVDELRKARFADRRADEFLQQHASANNLDKDGLAEYKKTQSKEELRRAVFEAFKADYNREDELARLVKAPQNEQAKHWNAMFVELGRQSPGSFKWTAEDFESVLSAEQLSDIKFRWRVKFKEHVDLLVDEQYAGNLNALKGAPQEEQRSHWEALFQQLNYAAPTPITWDVIEFSDSIVYKQETNDLRNRWKDEFTSYVEELADLYYDGDQNKLVQSPADEQLGHWESLLAKLGLQSDTAPPARQTCVVVTISEPGTRDFTRVVGRKVMGKPLGRIRQIATRPAEKGGVGIDKENLRVGGPPVDNVAIDEEGKITLARLVSYSALVGLVLAMLCFRSFKVTIMVFFVGGVSAACSLGIVWWCGSSVDAILMTMPSLVYVLGLSGAVHIVNYYRDAARESGLAGAPETAIGHGWFPCTLAAFTTSLGLISLYFGSNVVPIQKFGLYSAIGTMATVLLLFTFLPSALQIWPPGYHKEAKKKKRRSQMGDALTKFWEALGGWIVRRHWWVTGACTIAFVAFAMGLPKIRTSVHLLKLFDGDARIIEDYTWIEGHLGKLVPMELIVGVDKEMQRPTLAELEKIPPGERNSTDEMLQYNFLERAAMADRIQQVVEENFGGEQDIVGNGMSTGTMIPPLPASTAGYTTLLGFNGQLERNRDELLKQDFLKVDKNDGRELWRISLRLGSLNDIDYGLFVSELKKAVEPVLSAYRYRTQILHSLNNDNDTSRKKTSILVLGGPKPRDESGEEVTLTSSEVVAQDELQFDIDQTRIFCETLNDLFLGKDFRFPKRGRRMPDKAIVWHTPETQSLEKSFPDKEKWGERINQYDSVVLVRDHSDYDVAFIKENSKSFVDARDHVFDPKVSLTALERNEGGEADVDVAVTYTGIVPIVYKAQRTLLESLINSIGLAFVMIAIVMMILLRDWRSRFSVAVTYIGIVPIVYPKNSLNFGGGMTSMIPNVFPIVIIFGAMGHMGMLVDIGTMMTASVAMGVAVDDTIHFLNWYRHGLGRGLDRKGAINLAYNRCATAMTQTTLIGGFGLAVFALSTFTPTQKFGTMMLTLLAAALVGDLVFLPAILAGPLGPLFGKTRKPKAEAPSKPEVETASEESVIESSSTPHSGSGGQAQGGRHRRDSRHRLPGQS
jgi:predicted RND superfamily exporter protein